MKDKDDEVTYYSVVSHEDLETLVINVDTFCSLGWVPVGGLVIGQGRVPWNNMEDQPVYYQAIYWPFREARIV